MLIGFEDKKTHADKEILYCDIFESSTFQVDTDVLILKEGAKIKTKTIDAKIGRLITNEIDLNTNNSSETDKTNLHVDKIITTFTCNPADCVNIISGEKNYTND